VTTLSEACADLAAWLPAATALLAEPDADGARSGGKPGSAPPWNSAAAAAWGTAHALIRDTEQILAQAVTGRARPRRGWSAGNTARALRAIGRLGAAMPQEHERDGPCPCEYCRAVSDLSACTTAILQLAAIDEAERPQRVRSACPYCKCPMLRAYVRARTVTCLKADCVDGDGAHPAGRMGYSPVDQVTPVIEWNDGLVT
jgi:hypothetical protein